MKKAFTLIELLVVIAIIGLLSAVVLVSLNGARARARDARRISEINQIKNAIEAYYIEYEDYPLCNSTSKVCSSNGYEGDIKTLAIFPQYASVIPVDPLNVYEKYGYYYAVGYYLSVGCSSPFCYSDSPDDYILATRMEGAGNTSTFCGWNNCALNYIVGTHR